MSEYMFGVIKVQISRDEAARLRKIARRHRANFTGPTSIAGTAARGWFSCANNGDAYNQWLEEKVMDEVLNRGLGHLYSATRSDGWE